MSGTLYKVGSLESRSCSAQHPPRSKERPSLAIICTHYTYERTYPAATTIRIRHGFYHEIYLVSSPFRRIEEEDRR